LLILIAAYGLGALSAVIALMIGCIGMLGKLFADAIEETPSSVIESLQAGGANKIQIIYFGILPDVFPKLLSYSLFRLEINIRLSVMLGAIGAGGIGYELDYSFSMLQFHRALSCLIVVLLLVIIIEQISIYIRKKLSIQQL
jgi:phosphonate transport system permease protein